MRKATHFRRGASLLLAVIMVCTLITPALAAQDSPSDGIDLKIAVMSDTHYLSPTMVKNTQDYTDALNSDRKFFSESSYVNLKLLEAVREDKPDVLLVSGDLTKDGELEGHKEFSARLQQLQKDIPGLKVYVINGNHDIRNENAMNFNTADGKAVPATRTEPGDFASVYDFIYSDKSVVARYTPPKGKQSGQLSYVAKLCDGLTLIALDTCCYSADNTSDKENEHETRGEMSPELVAWATEQIKAAKAKGDRVIGLSHHGFVPHFSMEPDILKMYLIEDYDKIAAQLADAGLEMIFTGHMHANDIAAMTTKNGNTLYDIETGSNLTYPSPLRFVQLREVSGSLVAAVNTLTHVGPVSFYNAETGKHQTIDDVTEYGRERGFSADMLNHVAGSFIGGMLKKLNPVETSVSTWISNRIVANIQGIITEGVNIPVTDDKTLLDAVNYIYQSHLGGEDDGNYPVWVQAGLDKIKNGEILDQLLAIVKKYAFGDAASAMKFDNFFTKAVKAKINDYIYKIADSMGNDSNFPSDNDALIVLNGGLNTTNVKLSCGSNTVSAPAIVDGDVCTVFPTRIMMRELGASGKTVSVDVSETGLGTVNIWERGVSALSAANKISFVTSMGAAGFDSKDLAGSGDISVCLASPEPNAAQKRALGEKLGSAQTFIVSATAGGNDISKSCTLTVPVSGSGFAAASIAADGTIKATGSSASGGRLTCTVTTGVMAAVTPFPFTDVATGAWYFGDVYYAFNNALFAGTSASTFEPELTMTRGMLVTVLWRMEGSPKAAPSTFTDAGGSWYSGAVDWAAANGIVKGYSDKVFAPNDTITREQMAAVLYRYASFKGIDVSAAKDLGGFADSASVSAYAKDAMSWAVAEGIINGADGKLLPAGGATRAQVAAILHRYIENCLF